VQEIVIERNHLMNGASGSGGAKEKSKPEVTTYRVVEKTTTFTTQVF
jgi:hypothetical protein